jgi:hypothetical protein
VILKYQKWGMGQKCGETLGKMDKGKFIKLGKVMARCDNYSYIVRLRDGRIIKKRHYDLKRIRENGEGLGGETTCLEVDVGIGSFS